MARTAKSIITAALKKFGAVASGETPSSADLSDGLSALRRLVESWSNSDLPSFVETEETFTLTPGQQDYEIGDGGDFDTVRPMEIKSIAVIDSNGLEIPTNPLTLEQWDGIALKNVQSTYPTQFYFRTSWPLGKLHFFPVPSETRQISIVSRKPIVEITSLNAEIDLPPGYEDAMIYNLAIDLADDYGAQVSALTLKKADDSLAAIKNQNLRKSIPYLATDGEFSGKQAESGWSLTDFLKGGG